jgi:hypothetical protein
MKEAKEERAKQVLERKKELEKQKIQAAQQKLEKRPAELTLEPPKKKLIAPIATKPAMKPTTTLSKPFAKPVISFHTRNYRFQPSCPTTQNLRLNQIGNRWSQHNLF